MAGKYAPHNGEAGKLALAPSSSEHRKSYQFRALSRKSLSYQKRQWFSNICCVALCPLMMVVISSILGTVLQRLISRSSNIQEYLFCSNINASDPTTGLPISDTNKLTFLGTDNYTGPRITAATYQTGAVRHANYFATSTTAAFAGQAGPPTGGAALTLIGVQACEKWLGAMHPDSWTYPNTPYDPVVQPGLPEIVTRDTTFRSEPRSGWLGAILNPTVAYPQLLQYQSLPWHLVYSPSSIRAKVGSKGPKNYTMNVGLQGSSIALNVDPAKSATTTVPPRYGPANNATDSGMLSRTANRFYLSNVTFPPALLAAISQGGDQGALAFLAAGGSIGLDLRTAPYFQDISSKVDANAASLYAADASAVEKAFDDEIGAILLNAVLELARIDKTALLQSNASQTTALNYLASVSAAVNAVPASGITFRAMDFVNPKFDILLQAGTDRRVASSSNLQPQWLRNLLALTDLSNVILREMGISQPTKNLQNALISQGFRHFPSYVSTAISLPISSFIGRILFPWGVSFLIPIFVIAIVKEKEDRIAVMMKMNGLKPSTYYVTQYIQFLVLAILSLLAFLIIGIVLRVDFFRNTSKAVLIILFFIWANVQVSLAFFFSSFFSKNRTALIMTFLIVLCSVVVSLTLDQLYTDSLTPAFFIWPPFAFYRCLSKINTASWRRTLRPYEVSNLAPPDEVGVAVIFMVLEIPVYLLLGAYLSQVLPSEFGVRRPFWFPVTDLLKLLRKSPAGSTDLSDSNIAKAKQAADEPLALTRNPSTHVVAIPEEDDDVREERARVIEGRFDTSATPLYMRGMRKVYEGRLGLGPKVAVNNITVAVEEGRVFGLLGPNGAGKTTLISILTGIYPPTSGEAVIAGYNIRTNMPDVYRNIGVCPQHDILWDDLTVEEHLLFYARLKGVPPNEESAAVAASMKTVALENFATRLSKGLSGGEKRRLSIAIALVGNPACVFLDEPTTGLDPEVRRNIWTIIEKAREGKTIILTTHSMEEAEVLCQRIAIMAKGNMRCLGSVLRLKQLYGSGFKLTFSAAAEDMRKASEYIESLLPSGNFERIDSFQTSAAYEFKPSAGLVGQLFEILQKDSKANGITDWGLSQTSLEEVFLQIISDDDANAD